MNHRNSNFNPSFARESSKIVIDARLFGPEGTGVGTYVENLVENLSQIDSINEYVILLKKSNFHLFNPKRDNFKKIEVDAHWYSVKEQILIPRILYKEKPDLVHFPHFNVSLFWSGNFVVTIHDLTISKFGKEIENKKSPLLPLKKSAYNLILNKALKSSKKIITPSNFVKSDLIKNYDLPEDKVIVTYEAADETFTINDKISEDTQRKVLDKFKIKKPYILTVGNSYKYKNVDLVLNTLQSLKNNLSLVHVSKKDDFGKKLVEISKKLRVEDRFVLTGSVETRDLSVLYKGAKALVLPSLSEGFGLPGLEAMASGCPVIASVIEVFREVYGDAALYFDPKNNLELANKIELISQNDKLKDEQVKKGLKQVKKYSWRNTAEQTLKVYNSLDY